MAKNGTGTKRSNGSGGKSTVGLGTIARIYTERTGSSSGAGQGVGVGRGNGAQPGGAGSGEQGVEGAGAVAGSENGANGVGVSTDQGSDNSSSRGRGRGNGSVNGSAASGATDSARTGTGQAANVVRENGQFPERDIEPEPKPKRTRTRKTKETTAGKSDAEIQKEIAIGAGMLAAVLNSAFYGVSQFAGEHWRLQPQESMELSMSLTVALKSTLPDSWLEVYENTLQRFAPWVAVVITAGTIITKRVEYGRELDAAKKQSQSSPQ